jgi:hypothetical protein
MHKGQSLTMLTSWCAIFAGSCPYFPDILSKKNILPGCVRGNTSSCIHRRAAWAPETGGNTLQTHPFFPVARTFSRQSQAIFYPPQVFLIKLRFPRSILPKYLLKIVMIKTQAGHIPARWNLTIYFSQ